MEFSPGVSHASDQDDTLFFQALVGGLAIGKKEKRGHPITFFLKA
jgi:hypothetical protein